MVNKDGQRSVIFILRRDHGHVQRRFGLTALLKVREFAAAGQKERGDLARRQRRPAGIAAQIEDQSMDGPVLFDEFQVYCKIFSGLPVEPLDLQTKYAGHFRRDQEDRLLEILLALDIDFPDLILVDVLE